LRGGRARLYGLSCDELSAATGRWAADKGDLNGPCLKATLVSQAAEEPVVGSLHQAMLPTTVTAGPHLIVMLQTLPLSASECHHSEKGSRSVRHGALRHRRQVDARAHASPLPFGDHRTSVWPPKKRPRELDRHTTRSRQRPAGRPAPGPAVPPVCTHVDDPQVPGL